MGRANQWSGWRSAELRVRENVGGGPIPLEVSGGLGTKFDATAVRRVGDS
jgi:hypothetical protein